MRVAVIQSHEDGSNQYRMRLPAEALIKRGADVQLLSTPVIEPPEADVVVFNRPTTRYVVETILRMREDGYKVVVDIDDHFGTVSPAHVAYSSSRTIDGIIQWACKVADLVTVTTPALADAYGFGHSVVIPNHVPETFFGAERFPYEKPRLLWSGTITSHPLDLQVTKGGVARALDRADADFAYIGPRTQIDRVKRALKYKRTALMSDFFHFDQYPHAMAQGDIGIAPLEDSPFNDAKSWLKMLEYAAVGVVPLGSPSPENVRLHKLGIGEICRTPKEWYQKTLNLLQDDALRAEMAAAGTEVARSLSVGNNVHQWWDAWGSIL